jgi:hypothetical protein
MKGEPSIALGPLKIWVVGRPFPHAGDYWESNWLDVVARCEGAGSRVEVAGRFLHLGEVRTWKNDLASFQERLDGQLDMATMEPTLKVAIRAKSSKTGHLDCTVALTGDHLTEEHRFALEIDQSYLPGLVRQLGAVLREYPIQDEQLG